MGRHGRIAVCLIGSAMAIGALLTYPLSAAVAEMAAGFTLKPAPQATIVFDLKDHPVFTFFREQRTDVPLDRVAPAMIHAVLSVEDRRFYQHFGIDPIRVA